MNYDMLLIHPSAATSSPQFIVMPMGLVSVMNELHDYTVEAVNVGLEMCLNRNFEVTQFLKQHQFDMVGIDLHWHEHAYTALEIASLCKALNPDCFVMLGGFTASYFAEEILQFCDDVDVVVSGEAEEAVPLLLQHEEFSRIPNLVYRENGRIKKTSVNPLASLDDLDFSTIKRLHHWEEYLKCSIHAHMRRRFWYDFWLCTGRGCEYNCSYCGGASSAQEKICGRKGITFRSVDAVIKDLTSLQDLGVHIVCPSHDISLAGEKYWRELFALMKKEGIYMGMYLEVWQLPQRAFIKALSEACDPRFTTIAMTLLSGSESVRRKNGKYFSNQDYYTLTKFVEDVKMNHAPYFATGLPFETPETFKETLAMSEKLLSEYNPCTIFCTPLRLDPGSPMYENPEAYQVIKRYQAFTDYYDKCKKRSENVPYDPTGYCTEFLDGKTIMGTQSLWETEMKKLISGGSEDLLHFV